MKQKKSLIIVVSVIAVCLVGVIASQVFNWPVNTDQTSGNVAKSSRFSRKTAQEAASNMQELLLNDEDYKNGMVAAYLVMKTRAQQFGALVDMSEEVAGGIPEFKSVLKDMKAVRPMVENVCASMDKAGADLNAALGGETPKELAQNTTNAALAYTTLQKQNSLATRFIDTADAYLAKNEADNRLKFVRDQWVEYQQLTAILDNDEKAAEELKQKGHTLSADQTLAAVQTFSQNEQISVFSNSTVGGALGVDCEVLQAQGSVNYIKAFTEEVIQNVQSVETVQNTGAVDNLQNAITTETVQNAGAVGSIQNAITTETVQNAGAVGSIQNAITTETVQNAGAVSSIKNAITTETVQNAGAVGSIQNAITTETVQNAGTVNSLALQVGEGVVIANIGSLGNLQSAITTSNFVSNSVFNQDMVSNTVTKTIKAAATGDVISNSTSINN
jgi:hypothetical protein